MLHPTPWIRRTRSGDRRAGELWMRGAVSPAEFARSGASARAITARRVDLGGRGLARRMKAGSRRGKARALERARGPPPSGMELLLVPSALQQLALLVLSHLLSALLDHTSHWDSPCSVPVAPGWVRRLARLAPIQAGPGPDPGVRAGGGLEAPHAHVKLALRFRAGDPRRGSGHCRASG